MAADDIDIGRFAAAFQSFLERVQQLVPPQASALRSRAIAHLGVEPDGLPSLSEQLATSELPNLQLAMDALLADADAWELVGLPSEVRHYGGFSLASALSGRMGPHIAPTAASYVNVPVGVDETLPCVELGIYFVRVEGVPLVVLVAVGVDHGPRPGLALEVVSPDRDVSARFVARVRSLMHERNVYRGKVLAFAFSEYGGFGVTFHRVPKLSRADVILPDADLAANVDDPGPATRSSSRASTRASGSPPRNAPGSSTFGSTICATPRSHWRSPRARTRRRSNCGWGTRRCR